MTFATGTPINYSGIPYHCQDGMRNYIENRHPTGGFLYYVLSNNLRMAFTKADDINSMHMRNYIVFLDNEAPTACWGSPEAVKAWLEGTEPK